MKQILKSLNDSRIYILVVPATILLFIIDPIIAQTWMQWGIVLPIIAGVTLVLRKILFNTLDMSAAIEKACETPSGSGSVVLAVAIVMAAVLLSATIWLSH